MRSKEFGKLLDLTNKEGYQIQEAQFSWSKEAGARAHVSLKKASDEVELESSSDDFVMYVAMLKTIADKEGEYRLVRIQDTGAYYGDIDHLADPDKAKLHEATAKILSGKVLVKHVEIDKTLTRFLEGNYDPNDFDTLKLKTMYHETLAIYLLYSKELLKQQKNLEKKSEYFVKYYNLTERLLREGFARSGNPVKDFREFRKFFSMDLDFYSRKLGVEIDRISDLLEMLAQRGPIDGKIGIRYLIDMYASYCELIREFINTLRVALEYARGKIHVKPVYGFVRNLKIIANDPQYRDLVEFIKPEIRHADAHTDIEIRKPEHIVLFWDSRGKTPRLTAQFTFEEVLNLWRILKNGVFPGILLGFAIFDTAMRDLVLTSPNYKFMLLGLGRKW